MHTIVIFMMVLGYIYNPNDHFTGGQDAWQCPGRLSAYESVKTVVFSKSNWLYVV
jgi:hypothetical protein